MKFLDKTSVYKKGSNMPGIFSNLLGEEGLWYVKSGEADNGVTNRVIYDGEQNKLHFKNIGTVVEAYASEMYNMLTPDPNDRLTIKLIRGDNETGQEEVQIASRFIPGYRGIEEIIADGHKIMPAQDGGEATLEDKPIRGVNRNFILRYLLGDFDVANMQNIGLVAQEDGHFEGRSIDFGKAFMKPEVTLMHSAKTFKVPEFIDVVSNPAAPTWLYIFIHLIGVDEARIEDVKKRFADNVSEGQDRVNSGMIPAVPEDAIFPLPESVGRQEEVDATLKHLAGIDTGKIRKMAEDYEGYIVDYIKRNKLDVVYKKGTIVDTVIDRLDKIREYVHEKEVGAGDTVVSARGFKPGASRPGPALERAGSEHGGRS